MGNNCCNYKNKINEDIDKNKQFSKQVINEKRFNKYTGEVINEISPNDPRLDSVDFNSFEKLYCIGRGGFSKVWKVEHKKTREIYAMKVINKKKIYLKKSLACLINELEILKSLNFPLIVNLDFSFHDKYYAYLIMNFADCGDLRRVLNTRQRITENETSKLYYS